MQSLIKTIALLTPIGLPVILNITTSLWDGTFKQRSRFSAKLCFAGVSFDVWGLVTILRDNVSLGASINPPRAAQVTRFELGTFVVVLMFFHVIANYLCLVHFHEQRFVFLRWVLWMISILVPVFLLLPVNFF